MTGPQSLPALTNDAAAPPAARSTAIAAKSAAAPPVPSLPTRSSAQKAAAILALLDDKALQQLAGKVPQRHRDRLIETARALSSVTVEEQKRLAAEFAQKIARERNAVRGGDRTAQRLKDALFYEIVPTAMSLDLGDMGGVDDNVWQRLMRLPMIDLVEFFASKPASVLSIAMRQMPDDFVSQILGQLPPELLRDSMVHIATTGAANPLAVEAVEELLKMTLLNTDQPVRKRGNENADKIAAIVNRLTTSRREMVLEALKDTLSEDELAEIAAKVLSFEALEDRLPRNAIPIVFREVDEKMLLAALSYALRRNEPVAEYLFKNISQRLAAQYKEKIEALPPVGEDDGEKAQSGLICKILEMVDEGRIALLDPAAKKPSLPDV